MPVTKISIDTGRSEEALAYVRNEMEAKLGCMGDPLLILIRLEAAAERRYEMSDNFIPDKHSFVDNFINRNI